MEKDYHEDTDQVGGANVYNGQLSTLWVNFRQAFPDKIQETYQDLRSNSVLNYDELVDQFITKGSDKWSESIYNEDGDFKYVSMLRSSNDATNLPQIRGTGEEHFRYFIENRLNYCDSKWYAGEYISRPNPNNSGENIDNFAVLRIYTPVDENGNPRTDLAVPASADITLTMYSHMYAGVRYKANGTLMQKRLSANETYTFDAPNEIFNDTETAIYGAPHLSSLGDLAPLYLGYIDVGAATKLVELKIGDSTPGYQNNNLYHLALGTNRLLKKIDIQNCIGFDQALDLTGCPNIEEVYAKGSGITGVDLPDSGYLKVLQLPATIANLTLKNQLYIEDLDLEGCGELKTITIENTPVDAIEIIDSSPKLERVRLTDVNWSFENTDKLYELYERGIGGINESGANTSTMWIDGKCHITALTGSEMADIKRMYPYLEITYDTLESQLIFMALENGVHDNWIEVHRQTILNAGNGTNPVISGAIDPPVKESSAQYHFAFSGWNTNANGAADEKALDNIEADRIVYATFTHTIRSYTVYFKNTDTDKTLLYETIVEYGKDATYEGVTPVKDPDNPDWYEFYGWNPPPTNIKGETICYAQYYDLRIINNSWYEIAQNAANENANEIGFYKEVPLGASYLPESTKISSVTSFNGKIYMIIDDTTDNFLMFDGEDWNYLASYPHRADGVHLVVYKNELHAFGCTYALKMHYKWDGSQWVKTSDIPISLGSSGRALVCDGDVHILNETNHYKWDGSSWTSVSVIPLSIMNSNCVVYNEEIHIFGGATSAIQKIHYKWNGVEWVNVDTLPYSYHGDGAVVYEDKLFLLSDGTGSMRYYVYDGLSYAEYRAPYKTRNSFAIVHNNEIHLLGSTNIGQEQYHYVYDGESWRAMNQKSVMDVEIIAHNHDEYSDQKYKIAKAAQFPAYISSRGQMATYNGELHIITAGKQHYSYNGTEWTTYTTQSFFDYRCDLVVYQDKLHLIGGSSGSTNHYSWDGTDWVQESTLPFAMSNNATVVYNDKIHIFGASYAHAAWDGTSWTNIDYFSSTDVKYALFNHNCLTVYDGKIHGIYVRNHLTWDEENGFSRIGENAMPEIIYNGTMSILYDKMHVFVGNKHWEYDEGKWVQLSDHTMNLPSNNVPAAVLNDELYIFQTGNYLYKMHMPYWESDVAANFPGANGNMVEWHGDMYQVQGTNFWRFDGDEWTVVDSNVPYSFDYRYGGTVVYNDEIHIFGGSNTTSDSDIHYYHYKWDGTTWTNVGTLPYAMHMSTALVYNDGIHLLGGLLNNTFRLHYRFDGTTWSRLADTIPATSGRSCDVFNNSIYQFTTNKIYKFNGMEWSEIGACNLTTPYLVVSHNDGIYIIDKNYLYDFDEEKIVMVTSTKSITEVAFSQNVSRILMFRGKLHVLSNIGNNRLHHVLRNPRPTLTFLAKNLLSDNKPMNTSNKQYGDHSALNSGGWSLSDLREYCNNDLFNLLPPDLQTYIKEVKKYSDVGYCGGTNKSICTNDKIWVPSLAEVDITSSSKDVLINGDLAYPVFTDIDSRLRYKEGDISSSSWWLRTADYENEDNFMAVTGDDKSTSSSGTEGSYEAYEELGVLFGFCI